jgi:hypothetical protein
MATRFGNSVIAIFGIAIVFQELPLKTKECTYLEPYLLGTLVTSFPNNELNLTITFVTPCAFAQAAPNRLRRTCLQVNKTLGGLKTPGLRQHTAFAIRT